MAEQTPRMQHPYPSREADPWFDEFVNYATSVDASEYASREDRHLILMGGGTIDWDLASETLTWTDQILILSAITGRLWIIDAGSLELSSGNGVIMYVEVNRAPGENSTLTPAAANSLSAPPGNNALAIAVRNSDAIFFRTGISLGDGDSTTGISPIPSTPGGGGITQWTENQIVYLGKHGSDANDGEAINEAKLTLSSAITAASAKTPTSSNPVIIVCHDGGIYSDNVTIPAWVSVYAPDATLESAAGNNTLQVNENCEVVFKKILQSQGGTAAVARMNTSGVARVTADIIEVSNGVTCVTNLGLTATVELIAKAKTLIVGDTSAYGIGDVSSPGHIHAEVEDIVLSANSTIGVSRGGAGSSVVRVGHIYESGSPTGTKGISVTAGTLHAFVMNIVADEVWDIGASGTLVGIFNELTGTLTEAGGSVVQRLIAEASPTSGSGSPDGSVTGFFGQLYLNTDDTSWWTCDSSPTGTSWVSGAAALWTEVQKVYVDTYGNDSNNGLSKAGAKLTIASALTAAKALTPTASKPVVIEVGPGRYTLSATLDLDATTSYISWRGAGPESTNIRFATDASQVLYLDFCENVEIFGIHFEGITNNVDALNVPTSPGTTSALVRNCKFTSSGTGRVQLDAGLNYDRLIATFHECTFTHADNDGVDDANCFYTDNVTVAYHDCRFEGIVRIDGAKSGFHNCVARGATNNSDAVWEMQLNSSTDALFVSGCDIENTGASTGAAARFMSAVGTKEVQFLGGRLWATPTGLSFTAASREMVNIQGVAMNGGLSTTVGRGVYDSGGDRGAIHYVGQEGDTDFHASLSNAVDAFIDSGGTVILLKDDTVSAEIDNCHQKLLIDGQGKFAIDRGGHADLFGQNHNDPQTLILKDVEITDGIINWDQARAGVLELRNVTGGARIQLDAYLSGKSILLEDCEITVAASAAGQAVVNINDADTPVTVRRSVLNGEGAGQAIQFTTDNANLDVSYSVLDGIGAPSGVLTMISHHNRFLVDPFTGNLSSSISPQYDAGVAADEAGYWSRNSGILSPKTAGDTLQVGDGDATNPGFAFEGAGSNEGLYRDANGLPAIAVGGSQVTEFTATGIRVKSAGSSPSNVSFGFLEDTANDTGVYRIAEDEAGIAAGGALACKFIASQTQIPDGLITAPGIAYIADPNTGFRRTASGTIAVVSDGTDVASFTPNGLQLNDGAVGAVSLGFDSEPTTGFYWVGIGNIAYVTSGTLRWHLKINSFESNTAGSAYLYRGLGAVGTPTYAFTGSTDYGMWLDSTAVAFSVNGYKTVDISSATPGTDPGELKIYHTKITEPSHGAGDIGYLTFSGVDDNEDPVDFFRLVGRASATTGGGGEGSALYYFASSGTLLQRWSHTKTNFTGVAGGISLRSVAGGVSNPEYSWYSDTDYGMYFDSNAIAFSIAGGKVAHFDSQGFGVTSGVQATPGIYFIDDTSHDTGFYRYGENQIGVACGAQLAARFTATALTIPQGAVGAPGLSFVNDVDTGIYRSAADNVDVAVGGYRVANFNSATPGTDPGELKIYHTNLTSPNHDVGHIGYLTFAGVDANDDPQDYARLVGRADVLTHGSEEGRFEFYLPNPSTGSLAQYWVMTYAAFGSTSSRGVNLKRIAGTATLPVYSYVGYTSWGSYIDITPDPDQLAWAIGGYKTLSLESATPGTDPGELKIYHSKSATSHGDGDVGYITFTGVNDSQVEQDYARIVGYAISDVDPTESGRIEYDVAVSGTLTTIWTMSSNSFASGQSGSAYLRRNAGAVGWPAYSFGGSTDYGMWLNSTALSFSIGGNLGVDMWDARAEITGTNQIDFNAAADTIVIDSGGTFNDFKVGDIITVSGTTSGLNDGDWTIESIDTSTQVTVVEDITNDQQNETDITIIGDTPAELSIYDTENSDINHLGDTGYLTFSGFNTGESVVPYGRIVGRAVDATPSAHEGAIEFRVADGVDGSLDKVAEFTSSGAEFAVSGYRVSKFTSATPGTDPGELKIYHTDNSDGGHGASDVAYLTFTGYDDGTPSTLNDYARIVGVASNVAAGSESGQLQIDLSSAGSLINFWNFTTSYFTGASNDGVYIKRSAGTVDAPTYAFYTDTNYGMWLDSTAVAFSVAGSKVAHFNSQGLGVINGTRTAPSLYPSGDTDTGIYFESTSMNFVCGSYEVFQVSNVGKTVFMFDDGSPSYAIVEFSNLDTNPLADDYVMINPFVGYDGGIPSQFYYGLMYCQMTNVTDPSEAGRIVFSAAEAGNAAGFADKESLIIEGGKTTVFGNLGTPAPTELVVERGDTPGAAYNVSYLTFTGRDGSGNDQDYARFTAYATNVTHESEQGRIDFSVAYGGTLTKRWEFAYDYFGSSTSGGAYISAENAVGTPPHSFVGDTDSGVYRVGADHIGVAVGAKQIIGMTSGGSSNPAELDLYHTNTGVASGDGTDLGQITFTGWDSGNAETDFARIVGGTGVDDAGSELGVIDFYITVGGTLDKRAVVGLLSSSFGTYSDGAAPGMYHWRDYATSSGDAVFVERFYGEDSATNLQLYAQMQVMAEIATSGSEEGRFEFHTENTGISERVAIQAGLMVGNGLSDPGTGNVDVSGHYEVDGTQVVSNRITGWAAATGTKSKATFVTDSVTLPNLAARVGQLIDDLMTHGLINT